MTVARADREAQAPVVLARGIEVMHRMDDVVETPRYRRLPSLDVSVQDEAARFMAAPLHAITSPTRNWSA
jgi:hypothetical protein